MWMGMEMAVFLLVVVAALALVQLYRWAVARPREDAAGDKMRRVGTERRSWRDAIAMV